MADEDDKTPTPPSNVIKLPKRSTSSARKKKKFVRLRGLKCFDEIHKKILDGLPLKTIILWIQQEQGEATDMSYSGLSSVLSEYRASLPKLEVAARLISPAIAEIAEKAMKELDEVAELSALYRKQKDLSLLQQERIEFTREFEKKVQMPLPSVKEEIRLAKDLNVSSKDILTASAELKMDLGLSKRHIGEVTVQENITADIVARFGNPAVEKVLNNPASRHRVLGLAERLLLASKKHEQVIEGVIISSAEVSVEKPVAAEVTPAADAPLGPDPAADEPS